MLSVYGRRCWRNTCLSIQFQVCSIGFRSGERTGNIDIRSFRRYKSYTLAVWGWALSCIIQIDATPNHNGPTSQYVNFYDVAIAYRGASTHSQDGHKCTGKTCSYIWRDPVSYSLVLVLSSKFQRIPSAMRCKNWSRDRTSSIHRVFVQTVAHSLVDESDVPIMSRSDNATSWTSHVSILLLIASPWHAIPLRDTPMVAATTL